MVMKEEPVRRLRTEEVTISCKATGHYHLTVADVATFVDLCRQVEIPLNAEVTIERNSKYDSEVPADLAITTFHKQVRNLDPYPPKAALLEKE